MIPLWVWGVVARFALERGILRREGSALRSGIVEGMIQERFVSG